MNPTDEELAAPVIARGSGRCASTVCRAYEGEAHQPACPDYRPAPFGVAHCDHCSMRPRPIPGQPVEWGRERCAVGGCVPVVRRDTTDRIIAALKAERAEVERLKKIINEYRSRVVSYRVDYK